MEDLICLAKLWSGGTARCTLMRETEEPEAKVEQAISAYTGSTI